MIKCQTFFVSELDLIEDLDEKLGIKKIYECQAIARVLHIGKGRDPPALKLVVQEGPSVLTSATRVS